MNYKRDNLILDDIYGKEIFENKKPYREHQDNTPL